RCARGDGDTCPRIRAAGDRNRTAAHESRRTCSPRKTKTRNPNLEIRNKLKISSTKSAKPSCFGHLNFEFRICFGFRDSDFGFRRTPRVPLLYLSMLRVDGIFRAAYDGREPREPWPIRRSN